MRKITNRRQLTEKSFQSRNIGNSFLASMPPRGYRATGHWKSWDQRQKYGCARLKSEQALGQELTVPANMGGQGPRKQSGGQQGPRQWRAKRSRVSWAWGRHVAGRSDECRGLRATKPRVAATGGDPEGLLESLRSCFAWETPGKAAWRLLVMGIENTWLRAEPAPGEKTGSGMNVPDHF